MPHGGLRRLTARASPCTCPRAKPHCPPRHKPLPKRRAEQADLPIIAITGHLGDTEVIITGPGLKPVKIMTKPVSLMAIYREIGQFCAA